MTTDVLALREALLRDIHTTFCERSAVAMRKYTPQVTAHQVEALVSDRLDALIAAVRAETLAGAGVVEVCEQVSEGWPCGQTRDRHDGAYISHPYQPATPPTPVLTAARLAEAMREQHRPVPYHWSQSGESGTVCAGSIVGLHHRVERWPCDVESAILAALATPTPGGTR